MEKNDIAVYYNVTPGTRGPGKIMKYDVQVKMKALQGEERGLLRIKVMVGRSYDEGDLGNPGRWLSYRDTFVISGRSIAEVERAIYVSVGRGKDLVERAYRAAGDES
jgi:hypothetical protein